MAGTAPFNEWFRRSSTAPASTVPGSCVVSQSQERAIANCRENFIKKNCASLASTAEEFQSLSTCSLADVQPPSDEFWRHCRDDISNAVIEAFRKLKELGPEAERIGEQAHQACVEKNLRETISLPHIQNAQVRADREEQEFRKKFRECLSTEIAIIRPPHVPHILPSLAELKAAVTQIGRLQSCFRLEERTKVVCPMLATLMPIPGGAGAVRFRAALPGALLAGGEAGARAVVRDMAETVTGELSRMRRGTTAAKELATVSHLEEILRPIQSVEMQRVLSRSGFDLEALTRGIIDSDQGKLFAVWDKAVLQASPQSDRFILQLQGRASTPASSALQELLNNNGYSGRTILPRGTPPAAEVSPQQIRQVFTDVPAMRNFLHELPGLQDAFEAFNNGQISKEAFQRRVAANLFHNDGTGVATNSGFWQSQFVEKIMPGILGSSDNPLSRNFFENTVFAGERDSAGLMRPRYGAPISPEGALHAVLDRLSQGTATGIQKIFLEMGGQNISQLESAILNNPTGTIAQLRGIRENLPRMGTPTVEQRRVLEAFVDVAIARIEQQQKFFDQNLRVTRTADGKLESLTLRSNDGAGASSITLTASTPATEIESALNRFFAAEQKANGPTIASPRMNSLMPAVFFAQNPCSTPGTPAIGATPIRATPNPSPAQAELEQ